MNSESMLERLDRYYHEQGIPAIGGFNCKHKEACSAVCAPGKMISVPESYVGAGYEDGKLPRLLFVSSDTNNPEGLDEHPEYGALRGIREIIWRHRNDPLKPQTHLHQTLDLARSILAPYAKERLGKDIEFNDFVGYIANVRSTRCKDSSIGRKEGSPRMFRNCIGFLKGEIEVLRPDIIVMQGARARSALWTTFPVIRQFSMSGYPNTICQIVQLEANHTAIKIIAKHPCAHGSNGWKSGEIKNFVDWAAKSVQEFIPVA
jgi:hypothetical protein